MLTKATVKTIEEIEIMRNGGARLRKIKTSLMDRIAIGVNAMEIEKLATEMIKKAGGKPSFKMVPGYSWSTCVNINSGLVHGIPDKSLVFKKGDVVSVDVGFYFKGFHTDTSFSVAIEPSESTSVFMETGLKALNSAIKQTKRGKRVYDISKAIQDAIVEAGDTPIQALVGHGVGRELHEEPQIPCFVQGERNNTLLLVEGMVVAIEVMYTQGRPGVKVDNDGWTISMRDGKISALYEDTVAITTKGPLVLT